jgi:signal transduction histidine kinase/CheY-like chemotaxis protein
VNREERILVLAPLGRDAPLAQRVLGEAGLEVEICPDVPDLCRRISEGAGAVLLTEEVLTSPHLPQLAAVLEAQPSWSDLPIALFGSIEAPLARVANVTLLDRPVRIRTLVSAMGSALRARRRQYQTRDLLEAVRRSVRERDQFLAMLGHELRNPLAAVLTASELLDRSAGEKFQRERAVIGRQARNLGRLVDDLLEVSRVTTGKIALRLTRIDVAELVQRSLNAAEDLARRQRVELLPLRAQGRVVVFADPLRLEQVVGNLLTNAIKYTPAGGRVEAHIAEQEGRALVRVRDTGIGISADILPRVFELFAQAPASLDRAQGGMGIGLTLVKRLITLHGGDVRATSEGPGKGSEFEVRLPLAPGTGELVPRHRPGANAGRSLRVLVVEDNSDAREVLELGLAQMGHEVTACGDGSAAVEQAVAQRPEAMIVDLGLPGRDGHAVAREVRQRLGKTVRLIALSGYGQPEDRAQALKSGFDAFLTKPAELDTLHCVLTAGA